MEKKGKGKFFLGALFGAGLGLLFAPKNGSETRDELKAKLNDLLGKAKEIDVNEVADLIEKRINELKDELADLDKEKVLEIAKEKCEVIKNKAQELVNLAIDKGTPVLRDAAMEVKAKAIKVAKETIDKLEEPENKNKKEK